jgi:hypothetical protein
MWTLTLVAVLLLCALSPAAANVEKVVFFSPRRAPSLHQAYDNDGVRQHLEILSPAHPSLRRRILATFPSDSGLSRESEVWILLEGLDENQVYETRICWSSSQPTAFYLSTHDPGHVLQTPQLNASLHDYIAARKALGLATANVPAGPSDTRVLGKPHTLLLHLVATADYFTLGEALMRAGLLVEADISAFAPRPSPLPTRRMTAAADGA